MNGAIIVVTSLLICFFSEKSIKKFITNKNGKANIKIECLYVMNIIILLCFSFFRSMNFGSDLKHYINYFYNVQYEWISYEPLFEIILRGFSRVSNNFRTFMIFLSLITLIPPLLVIKSENKKYLWLAIQIFLITYYFKSFSILRAYLGLAFFFLGYKNIYITEEQKVIIPIKTYVFFLMSIFCHYSMLIFIVMLLLSKTKFSLLKYMIIAGISLLGLSSRVINSFIFLASQISVRYANYTVNNKIDISTFFFVVFLSVFYLGYRDRTKLGKRQIIYNMNFIMICLTIALSRFSVQGRLLLQFFPLLSMLIPDLISLKKNKLIRFFWIMFYEIILLFELYQVLGT